MRRRPEAEIMDLPDRARAYADADFAEVNAAFLDAVVPPLDAAGVRRILDLGCGPGYITTALADRLHHATVVGVDASAAMLEMRATTKPCGRCCFIRADALRLPIPAGTFDAVVSNSILHHVRNPHTFWCEALRVSTPKALFFHRDLCRPADASTARAIVDEYAATEHDCLREDFFNSLLAAYTPEEVRGQLIGAGILDAQVSQITDRHLDIVFRR